jgi:hypothetical protein
VKQARFVAPAHEEFLAETAYYEQVMHIGHGDVKFAAVVGTEVRQRVRLEQRPQAVGGNEFARVGRQERPSKGALGQVHAIAHRMVAMGSRAVLKDQQRVLEAGAKRREEPDDQLLL